MTARPYWEILGIPQPRLEDVHRQTPKTLPLHLMCVALVEHGYPMTISELAEQFRRAAIPLSGRDPELTLKRAWHGREPIHKLPDGKLALDVYSHELDFILLMAGIRRPRRRGASATVGEMEANWAHERREGTPVAIVHALPQDAPPLVVSILDPDRHLITTFTENAFSEAGSQLNTYQRVAGLKNWETLHYLALDHNQWFLIELGPHQKSFQLAEGEPSVKLTPEMIITGTTGINRPLHTAKAVARLAQKRDRKDLIKCVEDEIKALYALYRYGCLHWDVFARVGRYEYAFPVRWSMNSQPLLEKLLRYSIETDAMLDVVAWREAPEWDDPWGMARQCIVKEFDERDILLDWEGIEWSVARRIIQGARIVDESDLRT